MPMSDYMRHLRTKVGNQLLEIPSVTILTFDAEERVLLVKHADAGRWTTPGGAVEPEEQPANAAVREMWEETGLYVELVRVLGVYGGPEFTTTYSNGDAVSFLTTVFEGRPIAGTPRPDDIETLDVRYFSRAELTTLDVRPWVIRVLERAFGDRSRTHFDPPSWRPPEG
jgi:8-oxo-dGTP pyrophosphatase MutT (NUDIX family)